VILVSNYRLGKGYTTESRREGSYMMLTYNYATATCNALYR
jgi:hypothetical protein